MKTDQKIVRFFPLSWKETRTASTPKLSFQADSCPVIAQIWMLLPDISGKHEKKKSWAAESARYMQSERIGSPRNIQLKKQMQDISQKC